MFVFRSISNLDDSAIRFNALSVNGICRPQYETRVSCVRIVVSSFITSIMKFLPFCHNNCAVVSMCLLIFYKALPTKVIFIKHAR